MTYTPTNWVDGSTPLNRANMMKIENELALLDGPSGASLPTPLSTTLPGSPVDGQEVILVNSLTAATWFWRVRYTAGLSSAYKWVCVGGSPVIAGDLPSKGMVGAWTAYLPTLTAPFAGIYRVAASATITIPGATPSIVAVSYTLNGAMGFNTNQGVGVCSAANSLSCSFNPTPITLAAGDSVGVGAYTGVAANMTLAWVSLEPQQIG